MQMQLQRQLQNPLAPATAPSSLQLPQPPSLPPQQKLPHSYSQSILQSLGQMSLPRPGQGGIMQLPMNAPGGGGGAKPGSLPASLLAGSSPSDRRSPPGASGLRRATEDGPGELRAGRCSAAQLPQPLLLRRLVHIVPSAEATPSNVCVQTSEIPGTSGAGAAVSGGGGGVALSELRSQAPEPSGDSPTASVEVSSRTFTGIVGNRPTGRGAGGRTAVLYGNMASENVSAGAEGGSGGCGGAIGAGRSDKRRRGAAEAPSRCTSQEGGHRGGNTAGPLEAELQQWRQRHGGMGERGSGGRPMRGLGLME
ncbi:hypothetical protein VaNZ11_011112 [Volvox africanus]|uniref:Uncharacterized protein n=1 Tax=Volvox africanus TaxID=51714 RepID=A0ABQ5SBK9_9CHLO|nr:hypothetical protein VaNZ11_011112 [Volvox africanus]